jgi:hypothetical protein
MLVPPVPSRSENLGCIGNYLNQPPFLETPGWGHPEVGAPRSILEKHDEPLGGKRTGMGYTCDMMRKLYLPQTRDQPDMRAMRVAKAATRGRPGGWGRGVASAPALKEFT